MKWNKQPNEHKTWELFKNTSKLRKRTLKDIRGPTMAQAGYHHANLLASKIKEELQENKSQMLADVKEFTEIYTDNNE